jgi:hypothetical protein
MKTNIFLVIAFASIVCLSIVGSARCDGTVISISPSSQTLSQSQIGKSYPITINISDVTNLWQWSVQLNWNPNVLNFTNIANGPFLESAGSTLFPPPPQRNGTLTEISDTLLNNRHSVNGSGVLATVTFLVLAAGQSDITLNNTVLTQPLSGNQTTHAEIVHTVNNGQLIVLSELSNWAMLAIIFVVSIPAAILARKRLKPMRQCNEHNPAARP